MSSTSLDAGLNMLRLPTGDSDGELEQRIKVRNTCMLEFVSWLYAHLPRIL